MSRHPVAVVNLHITYARTMKADYSRFSLGGLRGKHVVATWKRKTGTIPAFVLGPRKTKKNQGINGLIFMKSTVNFIYLFN
jgi:IS1 family transposase